MSVGADIWHTGYDNPITAVCCGGHAAVQFGIHMFPAYFYEGGEAEAGSHPLLLDLNWLWGDFNVLPSVLLAAYLGTE